MVEKRIQHFDRKVREGDGVERKSQGNHHTHQITQKLQQQQQQTQQQKKKE